MDTQPDTRQRLVASAQQLVNARSYHAVGVQEICRQAGVKKGSFYHFFASKRELALAAIDETAAFARETVFDRAFGTDIPPLARIERFFNAVHDYHRRVKDATGYVQGCPFGNLACELSTQDEIIREKVDGLFRLAEQPIAQALAEAVDGGDLPEIDTAAAARAIFAYAEGLILYAKTRNDPGIIRDLGTRAIRLAIPAGSQPGRTRT